MSAENYTVDTMDTVLNEKSCRGGRGAVEAAMKGGGDDENERGLVGLAD